MKTFIFSMVLFFIILLVITANAIYVHRVCDEMSAIASTPGLSPEEKATLLCKKWKDSKAIFSFSVHEESIDRMDDLTQGLKSAIAESNRAEIDKQLFLLQELLEKFSQNEEISLQGII